MNSKDVTPELLQRYLQHECTPEEEARVNAWYAALNDREVHALPLTSAQQDILERSMLRRIRQTLGEPGSMPFVQPQPANSARLFYRIAASIAILALAAGTYWFIARMPLNPGQVSRVTETRHVVNTSKTILRQSLPDGSVVWLQPGSEMKYPAAFASTERTLQLKGEAFFSIARDPAKPFLITSGNVLTRVLGTSFNIKAYEHAPSIEVSVMTGKVSVNIQDSIDNTAQADASSSVSLVAQQRARYVKAQHRLEKQEGQDLPELDIWKSTSFIFENEPLRNVIPLLNEKFSVHIETENKALMNCLLRADLSNLNLPDILEMLSLSVDATYELEGNTIRLRGQGCPPLPNPK